MTAEPNPIYTRASQLGGPGSVPEILDGDIFKLPTFQVCLESGPSRWWRPNPDPSKPPLPAADRLPCAPDLVGLWSSYLVWRDSFRSGAQGPGGEGADGPAGGAVVSS